MSNEFLIISSAWPLSLKTPTLYCRGDMLSESVKRKGMGGVRTGDKVASWGRVSRITLCHNTYLKPSLNAIKMKNMTTCSPSNT